ncbi:hypothetical protein [Streptomyces sp. NPDC058297]|uniref:hypothetical protein n=1 Tax=Streptomyces sp. NPDC058297 TaxID=3346433 RepID=UPI0036EF0F83
MTTSVRRGRTLRSRLLAYITDAANRLRAAWRGLASAQTRLLARLGRVRPGRTAAARIRAAVTEFNQAIADFNRDAGAFVDRWASVDLPQIYRDGGEAMLSHAERFGARFTWTVNHQAHVTALSAQFFTDLTARIQEAIRRARAFLRAAQDAARSRTQSFNGALLRRTHRLDTVVYANNAQHPADSWALAAITWQTVTTANTAACRTALDDLGVNYLEVRDGPECGWETHDDPDRANRSLRTVQDALAHPTSHPHCVREFLPRMDLVGRDNILSGTAL